MLFFILSFIQRPKRWVQPTLASTSARPFWCKPSCQSFFWGLAPKCRGASWCFTPKKYSEPPKIMWAAAHQGQSERQVTLLSLLGYLQLFLTQKENGCSMCEARDDQDVRLWNGCRNGMDCGCTQESFMHKHIGVRAAHHFASQF